MLEKFLGNDNNIRNRFVSNASPASSKMFKLFTVNQGDLDKHLKAAAPYKRKQSGEDPYYKRLEYRKQHVIKDTAQLVNTLEPRESRKLTGHYELNHVLDQEKRFYHRNHIPVKHTRESS